MFKFIPQKKVSEKSLTRIKNPSKKIRYLFSVYYNYPAFQRHEKNLIGLIDIIGGLEHHFKNHSKIEKMARNNKHYDHATHEAIAYLNRIGQLYYLFISKWFTGLVPLEKVHSHVPSIFALNPIRNKIGAHRQQDYPRNDDHESLGLNKHKLLPGLICKLRPQDHKPITTWDDMRKIKSYSRIQYHLPVKQREKKFSINHPSPVEGIEDLGNTNNWITFIPTDHHPKILSEIFNLIQYSLQQQEK